MERQKLIEARKARNLTKEQLADELHCSKETISFWEQSRATPQDNMIVALCTFFGKDATELDLAEPLTEGKLKVIQDLLKNRTVDQRQAFAIVTLPAFKGIDFSALSKSFVSPQGFLRGCRAAIDAAFHLFDLGECVQASNLLQENMTTLADLALHASPHQGLAASLVVEAKIIQMSIATQKRDPRGRELLGLEAVQFGELSGDRNIHVIALSWHGDTYTHCLVQPETGITVFKQALKCNDISWLNKSVLFSGLALAYALSQDQKKAQHYLELAQVTQLNHPEADPLYRCIRTGPAELGVRIGRVYLILAKYFPTGGYAQMAYDASVESLNKPSLSAWHRSLALIQTAEAACGIGDLDEFLKALEEGLPIAFQLDGEMCKDEAMKVLGAAPDEWKKEDRYQKLLEMF